MTRADVLRMAREAGFEVHDRKQQARVGVDALLGIDSTKKLERFAALVAADARDARAARITAQTENEALKAKLAASGVAERRAVREAVLAEREACAMVAESGFRFAHDGDQIADSIRARGAA